MSRQHRPSRARISPRPAAAVVLACAALLGGSVAAQDPYNCDDFDSQFEAQTELNRTYPDDPGNLDADGDWIACEDHFGLSEAEAARIIPADVVNRAGDDTPPAPAPAPAPTRAPGSGSAPVPAPGRVEPPPEVMARVEGCTVIAISSRSVAAAGCPGVGVIVFQIPRDAPRMWGTVIINPGAAFADPARAPANQAESGGVVDSAQSARERGKGDRRSRRADRAQRAADDERADADEREGKAKRQRRRDHRSPR